MRSSGAPSPRPALQPYPLIVIDFNRISCTNDKVFRASLLSFLDNVAAEYDVVLENGLVKDKFAE